MNKQELIDSIMSVTKGVQDYIERFEGCKNDKEIFYQKGKENAYNLVLTCLKSLNEPEKPIIPKEVAYWINRIKCGEIFENSDGYSETIYSSAYKAIYYTIKENVAPESVRYWVNCNKDKFVRAFLDGYEIQKEPQYLMPVPYIPYSVHYCINDGIISFRQGNPQKFTQTELDNYFPDIKDFAERVDGGEY